MLAAGKVWIRWFSLTSIVSKFTAASAHSLQSCVFLMPAECQLSYLRSVTAVAGLRDSDHVQGLSTFRLARAAQPGPALAVSFIAMTDSSLVLESVCFHF